jgi:hypothetical protein
MSYGFCGRPEEEKDGDKRVLHMIEVEFGKLHPSTKTHRYSDHIR